MKNIFRAENYIRKPFLLSRSHRTDLYGIGSVFCAKPFYDGMLLHTSLLGTSWVDLIYLSIKIKEPLGYFFGYHASMYDSKDEYLLKKMVFSAWEDSWKEFDTLT